MNPNNDLSRDTRALNEAIERYLAELEAGKNPDRQALLDQFPDVAEELADQLRGLDFIHRVAPRLNDSESSNPRTQGTDIPALSNLGDFRILRELGRGGMGVVYEAEELSIGRRIALKVLPFAALLDPRQLQRFKTEARAAGALHHPNIVPVFSVGCERGVHYYAMQLIDGPSLAEIVGSRTSEGDLAAEVNKGELTSALDETHREIQAAISTQRSESPNGYFRRAAEWGAQAADALAYAHENGVLHRDIKPSNLLLDQTGKIWIADFGLARIEHDASMTFTGDLIGTLRYMSPEQSMGKQMLVDHRADIYGLGATLYELLTAQPPFDGADRQQLLRQIESSDPSPLRSLDPRIPVDLETIVLKMLSKEPQGRYASADELADDLRRFCNDRPILAKPPTQLQRCGLFIKRHPSLTMSILFASLVVIVTLAVSVTMVTRQKSEVESARRAASQNLTLARASIDNLVTRVAENALLNAPEMERVREELLQEAADFYKRAISLETNDPELVLAKAQAYRRLGEIHIALNQRQKALEEHAAATTSLRSLRKDNPNDVRYTALLSGALRSYADTLMKTHFLTNDETSGSEAEACLWEAVDVVESSMEDKPDRLDLKREFIEIHLQGASLWFAGLKSFLDSREIKPLLPMSEELLAALPGDAETRHLHARLLATVARFHEEQRDRWFHQSIEMLKQLVSEHPRVASYRRSLAGSLWSKLINTDSERSSAAEWKRVVAILQRLAKEYPHTPEYRADLANARHHLAMSLQTVDHDDAIEEFSKAEKLLSELIDEYPTCHDFQNRLWFVYGAWVQYLQQDANDPELLVSVLTRNIELYNRMGRSTAVREGLLANALLDAGRIDEGIEFGRSSLSQLPSEGRDFDRTTRWLAEKLSRAERHQDASYFGDRLVGDHARTLKENQTTENRVALGRAETFSARIHLAGGKYQRAFDLAVTGVNNQVSPGDENNSEEEAARWCRLLAEEFFAAGRADFARKLLERQFDILNQIASGATPSRLPEHVFAKTTSPIPDHWRIDESLLAAESMNAGQHRRTARALALARYRNEGYDQSMRVLTSWMDTEEAKRWARGIEWYLLAMNQWQLGNEQSAQTWLSRANQWMDEENSEESKIKNVIFSLGLGDRYAERDGLWYENRVEHRLTEMASVTP